MKPRWLVAIGSLIISFVGAWSLYRRHASNAFIPRPSASRPLAQITPEGALLYIEAKDFSSLLSDWNNSPEKARWLESDNNRVFSESRMLLRLRRFYENFAVAAGAPPDTRFVSDAAGKESIFALYDIGQIEFIYITHLPSAGFLNSVLWQSRNKFQPRSAAGHPFFICNDKSSGQLVAFAIAGDYLLLGTREDLVAHALEMLSGQSGRNLQQEEWFSRALSEAPATSGDLRMVLNLKKIAVAPQFRTYWIQQNITEMQGYVASVSDLYRQGRVYREERVLLRKSPPGERNETQDQTQSSLSTASLLSFVPPSSGFYQIKKCDPKEAANILEQRILSPRVSSDITQSRAPQISLTAGEIGSESDLDTRIDVAPPLSSEKSAALRQQFQQANAQAFLIVQGTRRNHDNVLLTIPSAMVVAASNDWNPEALQSALQADLGSGMTVATLGVGWKLVHGKSGSASDYFESDGIRPIQLAVRGKLLYISTEPEMLEAMLRSNNSETLPAGVIYAAAFNHRQERQNFYNLTSDIDRSAQSASTWEKNQPRFFSQNISSLSQTLERLESEKVVIRQSKDTVFQAVTYQWVE
ncbi:MAG TPA: hypothetical protein VHA33_04005 [Candidatus Angelobacter sp.]|jgi:hypothetical protein|nr:hypothetical protein [Candidatus Angelobacter sp.]